MSNVYEAVYSQIPGITLICIQALRGSETEQTDRLIQL